MKNQMYNQKYNIERHEALLVRLRVYYKLRDEGHTPTYVELEMGLNRRTRQRYEQQYQRSIRAQWKVK